MRSKLIGCLPQLIVYCHSAPVRALDALALVSGSGTEDPYEKPEIFTPPVGLPGY
jgi:hypothetical protein